MSSTISQELFDETVLENEECFDLSQEQALEETLSQYSHLDLSHLLVSHPHEDSEERATRNAFLNALKHLQTEENSDERVVEWLETMQTTVQSNPQVYLVLLHQQEAMDTLLSLFSDTDNSHDKNVMIMTITTLITVLTPPKQSASPRLLDIQSQLRDSMGAAMHPWMKLFIASSQENHDTELQAALLQLAYVSCRQSEETKKHWMNAASNGIDTLLNILKQQDNHLIQIRACQLLTTLCRFDDFRAPKNHTAVVSSAHSHALEFARHHAVSILYNVIIQQENNTLLTAALSALRVLAIHDDIVQTMVAVGMLEVVEEWLQSPNEDRIAATLGLIRNMCGNDAVKTTLCKDAVVGGMVRGMQLYKKNALLQEHGCGTMAAMALRKPKNAAVIVQNHRGHEQILAAMRLHKKNTLVQRQGALAVRNLASRSKLQEGEDSIRQALLDAGAEQVLREAGQYQSSVDEAYAALRDLGCDAKIMKIKKGKTVERTRMFGESELNFRPVLEESSNAAKHG